MTRTREVGLRPTGITLEPVYKLLSGKATSAKRLSLLSVGVFARDCPGCADLGQARGQITPGEAAVSTRLLGINVQ